MKQLILLAFTGLVLFTSCKKESTGNSVTRSNSTVLGSTPTGTTNQQPATYRSLCSNQKLLSIEKNLTYETFTVQNTAVFTDSLYTNFSTPLGQKKNAGSVELNAKKFRYFSQTYFDSTYTYMSMPFVWSATGSVIPAFTYTNTNKYPSYSDYTLWPDTVRKSKELQIYFNGAFDADEAQVILSNTGGVNAITYTVMVDAGLLKITPTSMTPLQMGTGGVITCHLFKNNIQTINGHKINFRTVTTYVKNVKIYS